MSNLKVHQKNVLAENEISRKEKIIIIIGLPEDNKVIFRQIFLKLTLRKLSPYLRLFHQFSVLWYCLIDSNYLPGSFPKTCIYNISILQMGLMNKYCQSSNKVSYCSSKLISVLTLKFSVCALVLILLDSLTLLSPSILQLLPLTSFHLYLNDPYAPILKATMARLVSGRSQSSCSSLKFVQILCFVFQYLSTDK